MYCYEPFSCKSTQLIKNTNIAELVIRKVKWLRFAIVNVRAVNTNSMFILYGYIWVHADSGIKGQASFFSKKWNFGKSYFLMLGFDSKTLRICHLSNSIVQVSIGIMF